MHWASIGLISASDQEIFDYARLNRCVLLTNDLDFPRILAHTNESKPSVVLLRGEPLVPGIAKRRTPKGACRVRSRTLTRRNSDTRLVGQAARQSSASQVSPPNAFTPGQDFSAGNRQSSFARPFTLYQDIFYLISSISCRSTRPEPLIHPATLTSERPTAPISRTRIFL